MSKKLQIMGLLGSAESVVELEAAKLWDYDDPSRLVVVENHLVRSYEDLMTLASQERYKDKEVLDVYFMSPLEGG